MSGRFITFEGGEGAGKSTQVRLLAERLTAAGIDVMTTREPGGTPGAEAIRNLFVTGAAGRWSARTEALLVNSARADHVERLIKPSLDAGRWVISDRYADSTLAYQGAAGGIGSDILRRLHELATGDLWPDLTLILDLPVEIGLPRALARRDGNSRFEQHDRAFHEHVRNGFRALADNEPHRCRLIDASGSIDRTAELVWSEVSALFG